jgi:hypothetical protein
MAVRAIGEVEGVAPAARSIRHVVALCLIALPMVFAPAARSGNGADAAVQSGHCDPYLPVSRDNPFGYRVRGDRCEGIYVQQITATPLIVASFGQLDVPQSLAPNGTLLVEWDPGAAGVRLRASSLKPKTYYRMDSRQPADSRSYRWPTDVLSALKLTAGDIGIVAWVEQKVGDTLRNVYLPIRVGRPVPGREITYELVLVPGDELSEVYVALSSVAADGTRVPVSPAKPLKYGFYPAGRSIRIPVGPLPHAGDYLVEIGATLRRGGAVSQELWFAQRKMQNARR